ncbi:uncharacterized protein PAC_10162 [Phialocephala subalpina]|uniref:Uncharacterized protein n=1 Tax=Phialocephala subalpina TaxID=576137 RepID=A0A1L7X5G5_9HELO|nr:uncharacterized protein PAC_10162 [Phialocephala subalpina]
MNTSTNESAGSIELEDFSCNETTVLACQPDRMVTPAVGSVVIPTNSGPENTLSRVTTTSSNNSTVAVSGWGIWKKRSFWVFFMSILTFILSVILVPPAFKAIQIGEEGLKLAQWTALKDFRENCKDISAMKLELSRACVDALAIPLTKPPFFDESLSARVSKRLIETTTSAARRMTSRMPWFICFFPIMFILSRLIEVVAIRIPLDEGEDCLGDDPLEETINHQLRMSMQEGGTEQQIRSRIKLMTRLRRSWPHGKDIMGVKIVGTHETAQG